MSDIETDIPERLFAMTEHYRKENERQESLISELASALNGVMRHPEGFPGWSAAMNAADAVLAKVRNQ